LPDLNLWRSNDGVWVGRDGPKTLAEMTAIGASRPLRRIPAIVSFLNPQPALSLVGGNRSSFPTAEIQRRLVEYEGNFFTRPAGHSDTALPFSKHTTKAQGENACARSAVL
jgi:hypothetical protein